MRDREELYAMTSPMLSTSWGKVAQTTGSYILKEVEAVLAFQIATSATKISQF